MNNSGWNWARLDEHSLDLVREAEATLGADIVLVYEPGYDLADESARQGLAPARLTPSELECLQGVEAKVGGVAVAYTRTH
jgi:hypothetical protein